MIEIVERSSGYYLVDPFGVVAGPFERLTEAKMWLNKYFKDEDDRLALGRPVQICDDPHDD